MGINLLERLSLYRVAIGYLGEREQFGWWQSSFFTQGSSAFLSPLFSRTQLLAQCNGVTRAAALVHDERIGIGNVYHLFRLPEEMEQGIHQLLHEAKLVEQTQEIITNKASALEYLRKESIIQDQVGVGPTRVGVIRELRNDETWRIVAGLYCVSFEKQIEILPYFANVA